jgi:hypothetical protein
MVGKCESSIPSTIQRIESTGREWRTWRGHLGQDRSRGRSKVVAWLGEAAARAPACGDRTLKLHSSFKRMRWLRLSSACDLYSPKAVPRKERKRLRCGFGWW